MPQPSHSSLEPRINQEHREGGDALSEGITKVSGENIAKHSTVCCCCLLTNSVLCKNCHLKLWGEPMAVSFQCMTKSTTI